MRDYKLREASKHLNINYSTAKTILRVFKLEKRINKKKSNEEHIKVHSDEFTNPGFQSNLSLKIFKV